MRFRPTVVLFVFTFVLSATAQEISQAPRENVVSPGSSVPRLVKFSASAPEASASQAQREDTQGSVRSLTFALFAEQAGGSALWSETQNVQVAGDGRYTVMLGSATRGGVPADLFSSGDARWLEVKSEGGMPSARYLIVSVPYALKAEDADRLAGRSAGDFVLSSELTQRVRETIEAVQKDEEQALREPILSTTTQGVDGNGSITFSDNSAFSAVIVTQNGSGNGLEAIAVGVNGIGLYGRATSTSGLNVGVKGESSSGSGRGVWGASTATSGNGVGVVGTTTSPTGTGVQGTAIATGGTGVLGTVQTGGGIAVAGEVFSSSAIAGKFFTNNSAGTALFAGGPGGIFSVSGAGDMFAQNVAVNTGGVISAPNGIVSAADALFTGNVQGNLGTFVGASGGLIGRDTTVDSTQRVGVQGISDDTNGRGVVGSSTASAGGSGTGVLGLSSGDSGFGVAGRATSLTGPTIGVRGRSDSDSGIAVWASAANPTGNTIGVLAEAASDIGIAVRAEAIHAGPGSAIGVYARSDSDNGIGVFAVTGSAAGSTTAIYGESQSINGVGVHGSATDATGNTVGVEGTVVSPLGIAGRFTAQNGAQILSGNDGSTEVFSVDNAGTVTATAFVGDGSGLTGISAGGGTSNNTPGALVQRDGAGGFDAGNINAGTVSATSFTGDAGGLFNIPNSATTATTANFADTIVLRDNVGAFSAGSISSSGTVSAGSFSGSGAGLSGIPNSATSATTANFGDTIVMRDNTGTFSAGSINAAGTVSASTFSGSGSGLTNIPNSATSANTANTANTLVARDAVGAFSAGSIASAGTVSAATFSGSGSGLSSIPNSATTATSANTGNAIVSRDGSGGFNAGNITSSGTVTASSFSGSGAALTGIVASNTTSLGGVVAANYARVDTSNTFAANQNIAGDLTLTGTATVSGLGGTFQGAGGGLLGRDTATTGNTAGVQGIVDSDAGNGVSGRATAAIGTTTGVFGRSDGNNGAGVLGSASSTSGITAGIRGFAFSPTGKGAQGDAFPVATDSLQTQGTGVLGTYGYNSNFTINPNASGGAAVKGENVAGGSGFATGVIGTATSANGNGIGVAGNSAASSGMGVEGTASHASGFNIGVRGVTLSASGVAGQFEATSPSGTILRGFSNSIQRLNLDGSGNLTISGTLTASSISGTFSGTANDSNQLGGVGSINYARLDIGNTFSGQQAMLMSVAAPGLTLQNTGSGTGLDVQASTGNGIQSATSGAGSTGVFGTSTGAGGFGLYGIVSQATGVAGRFQGPPSSTLIEGFNGSVVFEVDGNGNVAAASFSGDGAGLTNITAASATNAAQLGGVAAANYARLDASNTFAANQVISGNVVTPLLNVSQSGPNSTIAAINSNGNQYALDALSNTTGNAVVRAVASATTGSTAPVFHALSSGDAGLGLWAVTSGVSGRAVLASANGSSGTAGYFIGNVAGARAVVGGNGATETFVLDRDGKVTTFANEATAGQGLSSILGNVSQVGLGSGQGPITIITPSLPGLFRVSVYMVVTSGSGTSVSYTINYTDAAGSTSFINTQPFAVGARLSDSRTIRSNGGQPITYQTNFAGTGSYDFYVTVERLQ